MKKIKSMWRKIYKRFAYRFFKSHLHIFQNRKSITQREIIENRGGILTVDYIKLRLVREIVEKLLEEDFIEWTREDDYKNDTINFTAKIIVFK